MDFLYMFCSHVALFFDAYSAYEDWIHELHSFFFNLKTKNFQDNDMLLSLINNQRQKRHQKLD